jgi:alcohol dehydrogenase class IV
MEPLRGLESLTPLLRGKKGWLLSYGRALERREVAEWVSAARREARIEHLAFSRPLLRTEDLDEAEHALSGIPEFIVALGGGAVLDLAKCLKSRAGFEILLVAVPTTAGTGSEATPFATYYEDGRKKSLEDLRLVPDVAVHDPRLLVGLPRAVLLHSGMDALAQGIESAFSVRATPASLEDSIAAVEGIVRAGFPWPGREPSLEELALMQRSAYLSGRAIAVSRTTLAHALSYGLTSRFGVPHGYAVFLQLPNVIRYNAGLSESDCADVAGYRSKMSRLFSALSVADHEALALKLEKLTELSGLARPPELTPEIQSWLLAEAVGSPRAANNPRRPELAAMARLWRCPEPS